MRRAGCALLFVLGWSTAATAQAPTLALDFGGCDPSPLTLAEVEPILRAELADADIVFVTTDAPTTRVSLDVSCDVPPAVVVTVIDTATDKRVERTIRLDESPPRLWARTLALSIAELLRATWAELALRPVAASDPEETVRLRDAALDRVDAARRAPRPVRLRGAIVGRYAERVETGLVGLSIGLDVPFLDVPFLATISVGADVTVLDGPSALVSIVHPFADAALAVVAALDPVLVRSGLFVRGGPLVADAAARGALGRTLVLGALVAGARVGVELPVEGWFLGLEVEAGAALVAAQVQAGGDVVGGLDGVVVSGALSIASAP